MTGDGVYQVAADGAYWSTTGIMAAAAVASCGCAQALVVPDALEPSGAVAEALGATLALTMAHHHWPQVETTGVCLILDCLPLVGEIRKYRNLRPPRGERLKQLGLAIFRYLPDDQADHLKYVIGNTTGLRVEWVRRGRHPLQGRAHSLCQRAKQQLVRKDWAMRMGAA